MSKKHKRVPITTSKPQPPICSCKQGRICEEIKDLRARLELQRLDTECYKRLYSTSVETQINITRKMYALRVAKDEAESKIISTEKELNRYRRAYRWQRAISVVLTMGLAFSTVLHLVNIFCK